MNKQFISKFAAFAAVAAVSGSILMTQSCKKNEEFATDIKVEDSEDTEKTKTDIGVAEIKDKYAYMTSTYEDSVNVELGKLQAEYKLVTDTITRVLNAKATIENNKLTLAQKLEIELQNQELKYTEEEKAMLIRLATQEDILKGKILLTQKDSAAAAIIINQAAITIAKNEATKADELAKAAQKLITEITAEEVTTQGQILALQKQIQATLVDSINNVYAITKEIYDLDAAIMDKQKDSVAAEYSLMLKSINELNKYITDTATSNSGAIVQLDATQKKTMLDLLTATNNQSINMYKEAERVKTDLLAAKLVAEKSFDAATKAYDDYVKSKEVLADLEKTELTVVLFSMDPQGNSSLLTSGATVLLDGVEVELTNGMGIELGDLEGNHFVTVTADNHLKTQFSFTIDEVNTNDDAANFKLYKKRLEVRLLQSNNSFTVRGTVKANMIDYKLFAMGDGYDYLQDDKLFSPIADADILKAVNNEIAKRDNEEGAQEKIAGMNVMVKVTPTGVAPATYVGGDITNVSNFYMENTVAITAKTDASGAYELVGVPVLNSSFKVEVVLENKRIDQSFFLYGQTDVPAKATKTVIYNTQLVQNRTTVIDLSERTTGTVLFKDFSLF